MSGQNCSGLAICAEAGLAARSRSPDLKYARKIEYEQWRGRGFFSQFLELLSLPVREQL